MKSNYEKLQDIIAEAESLSKANITSSAPEFQAWKMKSERFLISEYGENSHEYIDFQKTHFSLMLYTFNTPDSDFVKACHNGINTTIAKFKVYLDDMNDSLGPKEASKAIIKHDRIFIVHGHDGELKEAVARIIEKQGIEAIILSEQANQGRTIIEKFENYSDVGGAICLFTADDVGKAKSADDTQSRARQNVVFETGYFIGKLGRDHIVILVDRGVEMPSDLSGVVHTDSTNWQFDLLKELNAMGYVVDANKLL